MPLIEYDAVRHEYPTAGRVRRVLDDVTVSLTEQRIGVIGANGSGKSTFVRMLNGLVVPSGGAVRIDGLDTAKEARRIRRRVGFCFTDPDAQIVMPTVAEDIAFGLRRRGLSRQEIDAQVGAALSSYGLAAHRDHPAHLLSGGQKQLLALAAVLVTEPDLLVLDEPTTLLDLANARRIQQVVRALPQQVVLVTHHLDLLEDFDRVLVFHDRRLAFDGTPAEAVAHYRKLVLEGSA
ncbi:MAG TPA: ABC transporter ATP-binding protein [Marmoricola sp.]|jgi:biotin transport system ATP-binding protein|nr:ABC transporter ATP-binding protein [Marmoricola sp.]